MTKKLPDGVWYSRFNGGMYIHWNGQPNGSISVTYDRDVAYGRENYLASDNPQAGMYSDGWSMTPFQGADGSCSPARITRMVANYGG